MNKPNKQIEAGDIITKSDLLVKFPVTFLWSISNNVSDVSVRVVWFMMT